MFEIQFILLIIICLGFLSKRIGLLKKEDAKPLTTILINFMLPALIIGTFSKTELSFEQGLMSLSAFIIFTFLLLAGWLMSRNFSFKTGKTVIISMGTYWGATLAYPYILGTFGQEGFEIFVFYDLVPAFLNTTLIPYICQQQKTIRKGLVKTIKNPLFLSLVVAFILNVFNVNWPFLDDLTNIIGKGLVFLGLLIVGLNLELKIDQFGRPLLVIFSKTLIGMILGLSLATIFGFNGLERTILILAATLPPSLMIVIFSEEFDLDKKLAANTLTLALPVSILIMTLISIFM